MIKVLYNELDGPEGVTLRLEAAGHAGYAPAGQDIVCAGASTLMQALVSLLAGEESTRSDAWDEPDGPRLAVVADAPQKPWVEGAFELAKTGFALLAERYPDNLRFADVSRRGERGMMDLQLFAEGGEGATPALSAAQTQQAIASGTMKPGSAKADEAAPPAPEESAEETGGEGGTVSGPGGCGRAPQPLGRRGSADAPGGAGVLAERGTAQPRNAPLDAAARNADGRRLPAGPLQ